MEKLFAKVESGNLTFLDEKALKTHLKQFEGHIVEVCISKKKNKRTLDQNNYYWSLCEIVGNELGYDSEEVHEIFKQRFLKKEKEIMVENHKIKLEKTISTTKLSTIQFMQYINKIKQFCAIELNIYLPDAE